MKGIPGPMTVTPVNLKNTYNEYQELHNRSAQDWRNKRVANCLFAATFFLHYFILQARLLQARLNIMCTRQTGMKLPYSVNQAKLHCATVIISF